MFNMYKKFRSRKEVPRLCEDSHEQGQSLVEYALILSLVAIFSIVIVSTLGDQIMGVFCRIVTTIDPETEISACQRLNVNCSVPGNVSGNFTASASVTDTVGEDNIARVEFNINGSLVNTEYVATYCLVSGDGPCQPYDSRNLPNGEHTLTVVAYDEDDNSGTCSATFTVSN